MATTLKSKPEINVLSSSALYLHWEGKRIYRQRIPTPRLLEPLKKYSLTLDSQNMVIEGDNLQVLASLKSRYGGEVDVVYIDPPYNLGKDDFLYSDRRFHDPDADNSDAVYVTNEDGGKHTKWLNFMAPRLYMLWEMLHHERGVIFISINDVELFRLGMLVNEIFGEDNWVGTIVWKSNTDNNPTRIAVEHEYILCYAKNKSALPRQWTNPDSEAKNLLLSEYAKLKKQKKSLPELQKYFKNFAKENKDYLGDLARYTNVDERGLFAARRNMDNPGKKGYDYEVEHPGTKKPCAKPVWGWRFPPETMDILLAEKRILFGKTESRIPQLRVGLEEVDFPLRSVINLDARAGSNDLESLFKTRDKFKNPKPVDLIGYLLGFTTREDSLVLDAFAGSGTTGEAVLKLNHRDKGARRFILIEEGRSNKTKEKESFCRTLTATRVRKAIETHGYLGSFTFYTTGRKLDRAAIIGLERDALANLICQADESGRGRGITKLAGYKYIIGKNHQSQAICLVWNGNENSEVTAADLKAASQEVTKAGLKRPFRIYGTCCRVGDTTSWKFCQIPDEILAQMHIEEDMEAED